MRTLLYPMFAITLFGADWPQLRGPNGAGLCPSCGQLPIEFGPQKNVVWKTALPAGKSSPVLVGDRILLTASEGDDLITMSVSRVTGAVQWRRSVRAARREAQNSLNHRAAPTPVTDGTSVFVLSQVRSISAISGRRYTKRSFTLIPGVSEFLNSRKCSMSAR